MVFFMFGKYKAAQNAQHDGSDPECSARWEWPRTLSMMIIIFSVIIKV